MGHAISRTKPSIVAFDLFAREPSIDVFCGGSSAATIDATPQPASRQRRRIRFIRSPRRSGQSRSSKKLDIPKTDARLPGARLQQVYRFSPLGEPPRSFLDRVWRGDT